MRHLCKSITIGFLFVVDGVGSEQAPSHTPADPFDLWNDDPLPILLDRWRQRALQVHGNSTTEAAAAAEEEETESFDVQHICTAVQQSFTAANVTCTCAGAVWDNFSITCDYAAPICSGTTCGVPQMALAMVQGRIFSATTCLSQYRRGSVALPDTCVFVDAAVVAADPIGSDVESTRRLWSGCTASVGGAICETCRICDDNVGLTVDCRNRHADAVSTDCSALDVDLHLSNTNSTSSSAAIGFAPLWNAGFCAELERALENRVACDCQDSSNASGGSAYQVICRPEEEKETDAVLVESRASVIDGAVHSVTSCARTAGSSITCTNLTFCSDNENDENAICACAATFNDQACRSCTLCDGGIRLDCSNQHFGAVTTECQAVRRQSSYEFVPHFDDDDDAGIVLPTSSAARRVALGGWTLLLFLLLVGPWGEPR